MDRAKAFQADQLGFTVDHDMTINEDTRLGRLTGGEPAGAWRTRGAGSPSL